MKRSSVKSSKINDSIKNINLVVVKDQHKHTECTTMEFASIITNAFQAAVEEDANQLKQQCSASTDALESTTTTSSSSSSSSSKMAMHIIPSKWMIQFQNFTETKLESDRPESITNQTLLFHPKSNLDSPSPSPSPPLPESKRASYSSVARLATSPDPSSVSAGSGEHSNDSFVMVHSEAQKFIQTETSTASSSTTSTSSTPSTPQKSTTASNAEVDERTKRRLKWSQKKEEKERREQQQQKQPFDKPSNPETNTDTSITKQPLILNHDLIHEVDYVLVGQGVWTLLSEKFGYDTDISFVVEYMHGKLCVNVKENDDGDDEWIDIPKEGSFDYKKNLAMNNSDTMEDDLTDLYNYNDNQKENDDDPNPTSQVFLLPPSTTSYIPIDPPTTTSETATATATNDTTAATTSSPSHQNPRKRKRYGLGLGNLGNTCFMNSTLQCLAHTGPLRSYFLSGDYAQNLNRDNPLGTGGELACEFANLLAEMWGTQGNGDEDSIGNGRYGSGYRKTTTSWSSNSSYSAVVYPRNFKLTLGKHAEQFMGYNQHDSQELATYLLDALHEDTNRISKKPYIEKPEQRENEKDDDAAKRGWDLHLKREDSKVMENFMGQVKSRVECPTKDCGRVSTTFDPFMYLSVPLPGASERTIVVDYIPLDPQQGMKKIKITLSKTAKISELRKKVVELVNEANVTSSDEESPQAIDVDNVVLAEHFRHEIYTFYNFENDIEKIRDEDNVVAVEVATLESIHKEIKTYEEENATAMKEDPTDNNLISRPNGRLKLDVTTLAKLNRNQQWEVALEKFLSHSTFLATLMNLKRKTTEDREEFHKKLCNFISRCYASPECIKILQQGQSADLELESSDGDDSEDGKMSPTSIVANQLGATAVDDESSQSLDELCEINSTFKNVSTPEDVAILEFCSNKFRQHLKKEYEDKNIKYRDGAEIQITFRKSSRIPQRSDQFSFPFVLRISPTLTIFGLRKLLASRLGRVLNTNATSNNDHGKEISKEEKISDSEDVYMNDDMDCTTDMESSDSLPNSTDAFNIMRQVPLTFDRDYSTNYRYGKNNSYRKLGSIPTPDEGTLTAQKHLSFAMPDDADENELVLDHVGGHGKVNICLVTDELKQLFDEEEWSKFESIPSGQDEGNESKVMNVKDCIAKYCQIEQLEESEKWYCNRCKEHVQAWKQFHLYRTPPILIIHLKRFHYSSLTHRRNKIDSLIDFPLEGLDLTSQTMYFEEGKEPIYDCYAVSNHFGGLGGGHYTAYALNDDGEWSNFDDSRVTPNVDKNEVVSKAAYVLYYKRRDVTVDDDSWTKRALPSTVVCSRDSSPVTTDMEVEPGDTDEEILSVDQTNTDDDEYGCIKGLFEV